MHNARPDPGRPDSVPCSVARPSLPRGALRHPDFRRFIVGQFTSLVGTWIQQVALGWLVFELTNSAFKVGIAAAAGTLPILLLTLYGGGIADRVNKRRALILLQSLMAVEAAVLAGLALTGHVTFLWIVVLALANGVFSAFEIPIRQSFLLDLVGREDLMSAIAFNSMAFSVSRVLGPAIAGTLVALFGAGVGFLINAVSYGAVIVGLARIRSQDEGGRPTRRPATLAEVHRYVRAHGWPRTFLAQALATTIFAWSITAMLPVLAREGLGTGASGYGGLMSAFGVGAAIGATLLAAVGHRVRRGELAVGGGMAIGAVHLLIGASGSYPLTFGLLLLSGTVGAAAGITTNTLLQVDAPDHLRGRVIGVYAMIVVGMAPVGSLLMGWVADRASVGWAIAGGGGITLLAAALLWRGRPREAVTASVSIEEHEKPVGVPVTSEER